MNASITTNFPYESGNLTIEEITDLSYEGVELGIRNPRKVKRDLFEVLEQNPIKVVSLLGGKSAHLDGLRFSASSERIRKKTFNRMKDYIDLASELNSYVLIGHIKGKIKESKNALSYIEEGLKRSDYYAGEKEVKLLLEPLNRYRTDFLHRLSDVTEIINKLELKNTYLVADTYHMNIEESESIDKTIKRYALNLKHVHVSDNNRKIPGKGCLPWRRFFDSLKMINYKAFVSVEADLGWNPKEDAYMALKKIRGWSS